MQLYLVKFLILFCALLFNSTATKCQNLVPNPSFEDTIACPTTANQLNNCAFWSVVNNTPDYFHECDFITGNISVPYNFAGFQYPATGSAYVGLFTFSLVEPNEREIIISELLSPLVVGQKYIASMKVSWSGDIVTIATNKIGMLFSTQLYSSGTASPVNNFSHVYSNLVVTDSLSWTTVSGSFVADSSYQYLLLGNFFDDFNTNTILNQPLTSYAYYYIDDILVMPDTLNSYSSIYNHDGLNVFPNPFNDYLNISLKHANISSIELYNVQSKKVKTNTNINKNEAVLNLSGLSSGIYTVKLTTKENNTIFTKISKL